MNTSAVLLGTLRVAGISLLSLSLLHFTFPRRLRWREELAALSLLNREIFYVHTFFVCLVVAMMGALCVLNPGCVARTHATGRMGDRHRGRFSGQRGFTSSSSSTRPAIGVAAALSATCMLPSACSGRSIQQFSACASRTNAAGWFNFLRFIREREHFLPCGDRSADIIFVGAQTMY